MELIGTSFENEHTALLVRATLARMLPNLSIDSKNVALVHRESSGSFMLGETIGIYEEQSDVLSSHKSFWNTLVGLLIKPSDDEIDSLEDSPSKRLTAIGIDQNFRNEFIKNVPQGSTAILLLVGDAPSRDQVLGVLRAFKGKINRIPLLGENRVIWQEILSGSQVR